MKTISQTVSITWKDVMIFLIVITVGLSVALYLYSIDKYSLLYYGDSVSHLVKARKYVDWADPGIHHIATVWLPLPHFMLLPFSLIDPLFSSGFAGVAVSLPSMAITTVLLFRMIKTQIGISSIAFVASLLYATNPNIIYLGITAMTEAPFMLFFVASAYYFQKWFLHIESGKLHDLLKCAIFVCLATLCRYEGWFIPFFLLIFTVALMLRKKIDTRQKAYAVLVSAISLSGIVFWISWNAYRYNDPLEFANAQYYSASSQALTHSIRETLFLQPFNVASIYGTTAVAIYGPLLLATAALGYILHRRFEGGKERRMLYVFLALPPIFTLTSLLIGIGEMSQWYNARFLILLSPLIILLTSVFVSRLPKKTRKNHFILGAIISALFIFQVVTPAFEVVTFLAAKNGFFYRQTPFAVQAAEVLSSSYDGGNIFILTGSAQENRIMLFSGISLRQFDEMTESSMRKHSFKEPWLYDKWMVISKEPNADGVKPKKYWSDERRTILNEHYKMVYENQYYEILTLKR